MTVRRGPLGLLGIAGVFLGVALSACHDDGNAAQHADASAAPQPSASASAGLLPGLASALASTRPHPPPPPLCRVASLKGKPPNITLIGERAPDAGLPTTITESGDVPEDAWVTLEAGGSLTARHPRSTRETTFNGPARFRSCVEQGEESWLADGTFESVAWAGERPGAEEWVMTPAGVVRYAAGRVEVTVTPATPTAGAKAFVKVTSGSANVWTEEDMGPVKPPLSASTRTADAGMNVSEGWVRIDGPRTVTMSVKKAGKPEEVAQAAVDRCKAAAKLAHELGMAISSPDASLATAAPRHIVARHIARAACGVAGVDAASLAASPSRDAMMAALHEAETDWKRARVLPHGRFH